MERSLNHYKLAGFQVVVFAMFAIAFLSSREVHAACSSPAANIGSLDFQSSVFKYCDGTNWQSLSGSVSFPLLAPNGTAAAPSYSFSSQTGTGLYSPAAGTLALATMGTQRIVVDQLGNVGIGTTAPAFTFDFRGGGTLMDGNSVWGRISNGDKQRMIEFGQKDDTGVGEHPYIQSLYGNSNAETGRTVHDLFINPEGGPVVVGVMPGGWYGFSAGLDVRGANQPLDSLGNLAVIANGNQAADMGGVLAFIGPYQSWTNIMDFATLAGKKENSIDGDASGYFAVATTDSTGNGLEKLRITSGGSMGVGTSTPTAKLDVSGGGIKASGQIVSGSQVITSGATSTINWDNGNVISTNYNCASNLTMNNLRDGGSYTLVVTDAGTTQCNFNAATTGSDAATVNFRFKPTNAARTATSHTMYTMTRAGTITWVSWSSGY